MSAKEHLGPGKGLVGGQYKPLTENQIELIHEASLAILARTGVQVDELEALKIFGEAGARVDGNIVRLSHEMVERAVESAPSLSGLGGSIGGE